MMDWSKYRTKPEADTIQDYPTIVDVIEDILEYEEQHLVLSKYPLSENHTELYDMEEPDHYFVFHREDDFKMALLYPTGRNPMTFYRGESKYHETCVPSLLRIDDEGTILKAHLQTAELECVLRQHPVIRDFLLREIHCPKLSMPFMLTVPYEGLAQHYGILTPYLDLTNDKWTAAFFAVTNYRKGNWEVVMPTEHQQYGSFYRLTNVDFMNKTIPQPTPLGMQYFNRPGKQSAFTLDMTEIKDLNLYPGIERIYFRHDAEANQLVYDLSQQGRKFMPSDSLVSVANSIRELKQYSQRAVEKTRIDNYPEKTVDEMNDYLKSYGLEIVSSPVVGFDSQQMQKEWEEWQREGATRYLNSLKIIPVTTLEGQVRKDK